MGEISTECGLKAILLCCLLPAIPTACSWQASVSAALLGHWDLDVRSGEAEHVALHGGLIAMMH